MSKVMLNTNIVKDAELFDSHISVNVTVLDIGMRQEYAKCKVDESGEVYIARIDWLKKRRTNSPNG